MTAHAGRPATAGGAARAVVPDGVVGVWAPAAVAALVLVASLVAAGSAPAAPPAGLADAGAAVRWGVPVGRLLVDLAAVGTVGALLVAAVLSPGSRDAAARASAAVPRWTAVWATAAVALAALTVWDVTGVPPQRLPADRLLSAMWTLPGTRVLLAVAVLVAAVPVCLRVLGRSGPVAGLALATVALTPPLYVGHSAHVAGHDVATGALVVHVVAATAWVGGLAGLVLHHRAGDPDLPVAARRFSALALGAFGALVGSGLLVAAASLGTTPAAWVSPYAALLAVKVGAVGVLGLVGAAHRRWTLTRLAGGRPWAFRQLVAAELLLMAGAMGAAVALGRTPGAVGSGLLEPPSRAVGPGGAADPIGLAELLGDWRPEPVLSAVAVVALVAHLRAARRVPSFRGRGWPVHRTVAPVAAAAILLVAVGLPTAYSTGPLVTVLAAQHVLLLLAVPALVAVGRAAAPGTAGTAARGTAAPWAAAPRWTRDPVAGFVVLVVATVLALGTPVRTAATDVPVETLVPAVSLLAGALVARTLLSGPHAVGTAARGAAAGGGAPARGPVLALAVVFLAGFGVVLGVTGGGPVAAPGVAGDPGGLGALADPRAGAALLVIAAVVLGVVGHTASRREGRGARGGGGRRLPAGPVPATPEAVHSASADRVGVLRGVRGREGAEV